MARVWYLGIMVQQRVLYVMEMVPQSHSKAKLLIMRSAYIVIANYFKKKVAQNVNVVTLHQDTLSDIKIIKYTLILYNPWVSNFYCYLCID